MRRRTFLKAVAAAAAGPLIVTDRTITQTRMIIVNTWGGSWTGRRITPRGSCAQRQRAATPARVTVTFTDGRQVTRFRESARGDFQDPYREDEVRAKFRELAGVVLSPEGVARVKALVSRLDELESASPISSSRSGSDPRAQGRARGNEVPLHADGVI